MPVPGVRCKVGGESDSRSVRRAGGSSRSLYGAWTWAVERGMEVESWVDICAVCVRSGFRDLRNPFRNYELIRLSGIRRTMQYNYKKTSVSR